MNFFLDTYLPPCYITIINGGEYEQRMVLSSTLEIQARTREEKERTRTTKTTRDSGGIGRHTRLKIC